MPTCQICRRVKPANAFYRSNKRSCKECVKAAARSNRLNNIERCRAFDSERAALREAINFCHQLKYPVDEFPIVIVDALGVNILGQADTKQRRVMLARRALTMGDMTLAAALIEEWAHIKFGFSDCSREMQNWLFESLTRLGKAYLFERGRGQP